jgi:flavin-dependent dehydrogenase
MAGLLAARVLADHVDRVTVLDRDRLPDGPMGRSGVPQGRHLHTLLPGGLELAARQFPGLVDELLAGGAHPMRFGQDLVVHRPEGRSYLAATYQPEPLDTGIGYLSMSRGLIEHTVRRRVQELANVEVRDQTVVRNPLAEDDAVHGVALDGGEHVAADLVVDAAGRPGRSLGWLAGLGAEVPDASIVHCDFAYSSALLRPAEPDALAGGGILVLPDPTSATPTRGGYVTRIEGGLWLAGLCGRSGDYPPADPDAWRAFGRTLSSPDWERLVGTAEVVDGPAAFRYPNSVRRHFERLDRFPAGLVAVGDAVCHANPIYGHGMSAAAGQARVLDQVLTDRERRGVDVAGVAHEFFVGASETTRGPWAMAAGSDFLSSGTTGDFPDGELENLLRFVELGKLVDTDAHAASLFVDLYTLRRPWATLESAPWRELLSPRVTSIPVA